MPPVTVRLISPFVPPLQSTGVEVAPSAMLLTHTVRRIVPEARILVGHGQMHEHELEDVMVKFIRHEADVLVSTTVVIGVGSQMLTE